MQPALATPRPVANARFPVVLLSNLRQRAVTFAFVSTVLVACQPRPATTSGAKTAASPGSVTPAAVPDEAFAASVHRLLRDGKASPDRLSLLAGVVSRQLVHAGERFSARQPERGLASMSGAFLLVRGGEFRIEMVKGGDQALASALSFVSPRGDEGRAVAFLMMQNSLVPAGSPAKKDNDEHLAALQSWLRDTRSGANLEQVGGAERVAVMRSLVEPTAESIAAAHAATLRWIE